MNKDKVFGFAAGVAVGTVLGIVVKTIDSKIAKELESAVEQACEECDCDDSDDEDTDDSNDESDINEQDNSFKPESFSSIRQADAYYKLLKTFNGNKHRLAMYILDICDTLNTADYEKIWKDLKRSIDYSEKLGRWRHEHGVSDNKSEPIEKEVVTNIEINEN